MTRGREFARIALVIRMSLDLVIFLILLLAFLLGLKAGLINRVIHCGAAFLIYGAAYRYQNDVARLFSFDYYLEKYAPDLVLYSEPLSRIFGFLVIVIVLTIVFQVLYHAFAPFFHKAERWLFPVYWLDHLGGGVVNMLFIAYAVLIILEFASAFQPDLLTGSYFIEFIRGIFYERF